MSATAWAERFCLGDRNTTIIALPLLCLKVKTCPLNVVAENSSIISSTSKACRPACSVVQKRDCTITSAEHAHVAILLRAIILIPFKRVYLDSAGHAE